MNIPNTLSLLRLVLIVPILWLMVKNEMELALGLFVFTAFTDVLDGWVARHFHQETALGGQLDGLADKLFVFAVFLGFFAQGKLPIWGFLIFARDLGVTAKLFMLWSTKRWHQKDRTHVSFSGKLTTFLEVLLFVILFFVETAPSGLLAVTVIASVAAGLDYIFQKTPSLSKRGDVSFSGF